MDRHDDLPDAKHVSWDGIPVERVAEGIERQVAWGERLMLCRVRFAPHVAVGVHTHLHEQMSVVQKGSARFTVGDQSRVLSAGEAIIFPSQVAHGVTMLDEEVIILDVFTPVREDFLPRAT